MQKDKQNRFPRDFLWGASTSAHQVEGGTHNQWTVWELENAARLARESAKHYEKLPIWNDIKVQAQDPANYISGPAVDHYRRYKEDFEFLKELNLNTFRFGIEWSRIEPEQGEYDHAEIEHYKQYIAELKAQGIQPIPNLWHWTVPIWFDKLGGFTRRKNIEHFVKYAEKIAEELLIPCGIVLTLNEPNSYVGMGYFDRQWPPQKNDPVEAVSVMLNLARAHRRIYRMLKKKNRDLQVGVATQCNNNQPKRPGNYFDRFMAASANYTWNWWFLNRIRRCQDFVGFNYYFTDYFKGLQRKNPQKHYHRHHAHQGHRGVIRQQHHNPEGPLNDMGWYMEPSGLYNVIMSAAKRYRKPIIITETGVADMHDAYRQWWIDETLDAVYRANTQDANVKGYLFWSLLDNFEWSQGFWPKFGLVKVDRENNLKRTIRPSARRFAEEINSQTAGQ
jgi:beta-glucosidase